ncbi:FHA domain-containing protein [Slackia heliotrinireducens]|uniref:FHA domain-containing protein n=1 Tax=Slackia heliotrinireducens (strain ATCC 29202 / DSM 20476 / NCTC 11029 / RHS 1) TaxID=471855 RepID=C7N632_SLAHD|nr:FHA domain-containing protein [Slackia heliotrinireducens]ACV22367.1 FHA domain-containing protein [Slackia heliotrinireducens DSM 20476]VEH00647.1 Uncharacterized conserved protein, contains FHA domain [Slackia heliotrinireducens]
MTEKCPVCNTVLDPGATACPICGFKLLGRTQAFTPIAMQPNDVTANAGLLNEATLRIVKGAQVGSIFHLSADTITMGRNPHCDIFLNDMTVSRNHAVFERRGSGYAIIDQGSFNGLWINHENVHEAVLRDGDLIEVGAFILLYQTNPGH